MNFSVFKVAVAAQFERMQKHQLFRVDVDKDLLWQTYLQSFPEGTNPMFRERTEHDCSCCKQFIRSVGDVVAVIDGKLASIWDVGFMPTEPGYESVARALAALVKSRPIADHFLHYERTAGTDRNFEQLTEGTKTWQHFHVNIDRKFIMDKASIPTKLGGLRADHDVLQRSLSEITPEAVDTVLELIAQNSLYRGAEHKSTVTEFKNLQRQYMALLGGLQANFTWTVGTFGSVARIRNTAIGTLLVDLSKGKDLEDAVKAFEAMVAPANYKRPTALITKAMIDKAKQKIEELGLTSALERRHAAITDITVNNILFADRSARKAMGDDVFGDLAASASAQVGKLDRIEEVPIERFIADILPRAESLEVLLENHHQSNLVSLIAPVNPTSRGLFKWDNNFSWSYAGEMADSIKERVKAAGGSVTGDLCCRLAWDYVDDLDLHMIEPDGGHICYSSRRMRSRCGGMLDVDANGIDGPRKDPVENIFYSRLSDMRDGVYTLNVNNFNRHSDGTGFQVELEFGGETYSIGYDKVLRDRQTVQVAKIQKKGDKLTLLESLPTSKSSKLVWGVPTQTFHKVRIAMLSPNQWDDKPVGNRHYFFMLEGCQNDGTARGFFNEFLRADLNEHRKVFEVVASKMKPAPSTDQLSGLGFSSTQRNHVVCRVKGSFSRLVKVVF